MEEEEKTFTVLENKIKVLPHACFVCSKAFVRKNTLLKHYREHTKEFGSSMERFDEVKGVYLSKKLFKNPLSNNDAVSFVNDGNAKGFSNPILNLDGTYCCGFADPIQDDVYPGLTDETDENGDQSVIQNLDSNDLIITDMDSSEVMVQNLDPDSIVVEHLEPQPLEPAETFLTIPDPKERHGCTICGNCFSAASSLKRHMSIHDSQHAGSVYYNCAICNASFLRKTALKNHYRIHKGLEEFECPKCSEKFFTQQDLTSHRLMSHKMKTKKNHNSCYVCEICGDDFFKKSALKMHYLSHPEERPYVCDVCNESFSVDGTFQEHMIMHGPEYRYACKVCWKRFLRKSDLQRHKAQCHSDEKSKKQPLASKDTNRKRKNSKAEELNAEPTKKKLFVCTTCTNAFRDKAEFEKHKKTHSKKTLACEVCDQQVEQDLYEDHMLWHNEGKSHTCRVCRESFLFKDDLLEHSRTAHIEDLPFRCNVCEDGFKFKSDLREHKQIHVQKDAAKKLLSCKKCGDTFLLKTDLTQHNKTPCKVKNHACGSCDEKFATRSELAEHEESHEATNDSDYDYEEYQLQFPCKFCSETFCTKSEASEHMTECPKKRAFLCKNCNQRFKTKAELLNHKKVHSRRQPFICKVCNEGFKDKDDLEEHGKIHNTAPTFPCNICNEVFVQKESLKEHKLVHDGEIVYICSVCDATFEDKTEFRAHRETHDVIVYQCKVCNEAFKIRKELKKHYLKHILERPNMCRICNASFEQWGALRSHYLSHTRS